MGDEGLKRFKAFMKRAEAQNKQEVGCYKPINKKTEPVAKLQCSDGLCPVHIGIDLADGPDRTAYVCPVCHNEIRGNDKVCCGVWHE